MFDSSKAKVRSQPDTGEVIAKRKGVPATEGLKEAWSKLRGDVQEPDH